MGYFGARLLAEGYSSASLMLSYDLCRQLKEKGFPQGKFPKPDAPHEGDSFQQGSHFWIFRNEDWVRVPYIEDLLRELTKNECGDVHLEACFGKWQASTCVEPKGKEVPWYDGDTPEEALCNLFIALHP